ncbi:DUF551 domain-containing protein [Salmonella enterica subsp. enterica serovar Saintpaul]|nr:DUF551 domain-containing protein [Salmonella enterica]EDS5587251.1 DUF551 domain-containing protein [Salmonella enterica subsp. enterica serovar Saintpaul]EDX7744301.1 DUF551 domain-containing protein [Salmonella enterica subsp. enterica serovar Saintpaul]MBA3116991.1 DUF551 domain-containing protein [Salmonella enterica]
MTTITREQLIEKLQNRIAVTANYPGVEEAQLDAAIFKIALASLEAKPIGAFHIADQQVDGTTDYIKDGEWPIDNGVIDVYAAPPAPIVPDEWTIQDAVKFCRETGRQDAGSAMDAWNACRSAMLHGAEPVSQTNKLPHTQFEQVADLYEMQFDDGRTCAFHTDAQKAVQWLQACDGNRVQEYVKLERLQNALAGNSPVTPDGWISCSERMPEDEQEVIVQNKLGYRYVSYFDEQSGLFFDMRGGNQINCIEHILVTHWMPLPAAPQQEVNHG